MSTTTTTRTTTTLDTLRHEIRQAAALSEHGQEDLPACFTALEAAETASRTYYEELLLLLKQKTTSQERESSSSSSSNASSDDDLILVAEALLVVAFAVTSHADLYLLTEEYDIGRAKVTDGFAWMAKFDEKVQALPQKHYKHNSELHQEASLIRLNLYLNRSVAEFHVDKKRVPTWDNEGAELARHLLLQQYEDQDEEDDENEHDDDPDSFGNQVAFYYATFVSFQASNQQSCELFGQALERLSMLAAKAATHEDRKREEGEVYHNHSETKNRFIQIHRRWASTLRIASYTYRQANQKQHGGACSQQAIDLCVALHTQYPHNTWVLRELAYCWGAKLDYVRSCPESTSTECLTCLEAQIAVRKTLRQLWPSFAGNLESLADALLEVFDLCGDEQQQLPLQETQQEQQQGQRGNNHDTDVPDKDQVLASLEEKRAEYLRQASDAAAAAIDCPEPKFDHLDSWTRCLAAQASIVASSNDIIPSTCTTSSGSRQNKDSKRQPDYDKAFDLYRQYHSVFTQQMIPHRKQKVHDSPFYADTFQRNLEEAAWYALEAERPDVCLELYAMGDNVAATCLKGERRYLVQRGSTWMRLGNGLLRHQYTVQAATAFQRGLALTTPVFDEFPWHTYNTVVYGYCHHGLAGIARKASEKKKGENRKNNIKEVFHSRRFLDALEVLHGTCYDELRQQERFLQQQQQQQQHRCELPMAHWRQQSHFQRDGVLSKVVAAHELAKLREKLANPPSLRKFTVTCYVRKSDKYLGYTLYLATAIPDRHPVEHQVRLLEEDFTAVMPEDVLDALEQLHTLALKNNVSLPDLCAHAFKHNPSIQ